MLQKYKQDTYLESTVTAAKNTPTTKDLKIRSSRKKSDSFWCIKRENEVKIIDKCSVGCQQKQKQRSGLLCEDQEPYTGAHMNITSEDYAKMWERNHNTQRKTDINCEYIILNKFLIKKKKKDQTTVWCWKLGIKWN